MAADENKPIFLSIGYAACHWCHVMEHESFEDEEVARVLNEHFIPIKVDREERPDLDEIYMNATILYTRGHGGWPMSVWLTPDGKPFFAGTYFPREDNYGRPGFKSVLEQVAELWQKKTGDLVSDATQVAGILENLHKPQKGEMLSREAISEAARQMFRAYDTNHGGVGSGNNKFPPSMSMQLLLREHCNGGSPEMLEAVGANFAADGMGRHLRPSGRRNPSLQHRPAVAGSALREDAIRPSLGEFHLPGRIPRDPKEALCGNGPRHLRIRDLATPKRGGRNLLHRGC